VEHFPCAARVLGSETGRDEDDLNLDSRQESDALVSAVLQANEYAVAAAASEARMRAVLASVTDGVLTFDEQGTIESVNPAAERLFGRPAVEMLSLPINQLLPDMNRLLLVGAGIGTPQETEAVRADGGRVPVEVTVSTVVLPEGKLLLGVVRDVTERKVAAAELEQQARTDTLTGVANRRGGTRDLERLLSLAERQQQRLSVVLLDLDHFKKINDQYGHAVGDEVLREFGRLLETAFRLTDVVARWGGEEFLIGLHDCSKHEAAKKLNAVLRSQSLGHLPGPTPGGGGPSFSAGVAEYPGDGRDLDALYRAADAALYHAKESGRSRVVIVDAESVQPRRAT
jgi:diguanylate cyclase (GGDEF)-like protein/PAS domain S-box-containing protein